MQASTLRKSREAKGLSRKKLAALSELHPDFIRHWENKAALNQKAMP
jgi:ribosome-binding protein aMBF1 (putative translation factor)